MAQLSPSLLYYVTPCMVKHCTIALHHCTHYCSGSGLFRSHWMYKRTSTKPINFPLIPPYQKECLYQADDSKRYLYCLNIHCTGISMGLIPMSGIITNNVTVIGIGTNTLKCKSSYRYQNKSLVSIPILIPCRYQY